MATLEIKGLKPPERTKAEAKPSFPDAAQVPLETVRLKPVDGKIRLHVELTLPEGYKINPLAPLRYLVEAEGTSGPIVRDGLGRLVRVEPPSDAFDIELPATASAGSDKLKISLQYYYCQKGSEGVCKAGSVIWSVPIELSDEATASSATLPFKVPQ